MDGSDAACVCVVLPPGAWWPGLVTVVDREKEAKYRDQIALLRSEAARLRVLSE